MNTAELANLVEQDTILANHFLGIHARDQLPSQVTRKPSAVIINTDPIREKGEHWVAVFFDMWNKAEYFDSYGFGPLHDDIERFITENSQSFSYNSLHLQSVTSSVCGMYCIFYLTLKCRGYTMKDIQDLLSDNPETNDSIVCKFIKSRFHYEHTVCTTLQSCVPYCDRLKKYK